MDVTSPNATPSGACVVARSSSSLDGDDREGDGLRSVDGVPSPRAAAARSTGTRRMGQDFWSEVRKRVNVNVNMARG